MEYDVRLAATSIAGRAGTINGAERESVIGIIMLLIPMIPSLLQLCGGNQSAREVAASHYDPDTNTFDRGAIQRLFPELRRAQARRNEQTGERVRLSRQELKKLAVAALTEAKDADESYVVSVMASAGQMSGVGNE